MVPSPEGVVITTTKGDQNQEVIRFLALIVGLLFVAVASAPAFEIITAEDIQQNAVTKDACLKLADNNVVDYIKITRMAVDSSQPWYDENEIGGKDHEENIHSRCKEALKQVGLR